MKRWESQAILEGELWVNFLLIANVNRWLQVILILNTNINRIAVTYSQCLGRLKIVIDKLSAKIHLIEIVDKVGEVGFQNIILHIWLPGKLVELIVTELQLIIIIAVNGRKIGKQPVIKQMVPS